jgi:hypothetical protein
LRSNLVVPSGSTAPRCACVTGASQPTSPNPALATYVRACQFINLQDTLRGKGHAQRRVVWPGCLAMDVGDSVPPPRGHRTQALVFFSASHKQRLRYDGRCCFSRRRGAPFSRQWRAGAQPGARTQKKHGTQPGGPGRSVMPDATAPSKRNQQSVIMAVYFCVLPVPASGGVPCAGRSQLRGRRALSGELPGAAVGACTRSRRASGATREALLLLPAECPRSSFHRICPNLRTWNRRMGRFEYTPVDSRWGHRIYRKCR